MREAIFISCNVTNKGQCVRWEEYFVERKLSWIELWAWRLARLSFLVKSTYDMLPSPANLVRWKVSEEDKCQCGQYGTLRHILSARPLGLKDRYTWRPNQALRVIVDGVETKVNEINQGKLPVKECQGKVVFHQEGKKGVTKPSPKQQMVDERWQGSWKMAADLDSSLVFPFVSTSQ